MSPPSLQLTARDFDAYSADKATSKAFSRPRLEAKQRALAWARGVVARLAELGISVDVHGSDEHPSIRNRNRVDCQWVFFWRDAAAREELERLLDRGRSISAAIDDPSPYTRHAFLALRIAEGEVEVCFAVHPDAKVDVDNLRARFEARAEAGEGAAPLAAELTGALHALPEEFTFGVGADRVACSAATTEAILSMLHRAAEGKEPLWIGWSVPRETALAHAGILDEQLEDALVALAPIYRIVAWSRENDRIALDRRLEGIEQERARAHAELEAENERWRAEQAAARERSMEEARARLDARAEAALPPRRPTLATLFNIRGSGSPRPEPARRPQAEAPGDRPRRAATPERAPERGDAAKAAKAASQGGEPERAAPARADAGERERSAPAVMEKGSRVRVLRGPFGDKIGVIGELDGRGGARVLLGLLSTRLDLGDLELVPEGRERPALSTSHRKPHAPVPRRAR
ncbi:MAG: hypothetical protein IT372_14950 [Polyangiaceae bacterium]|nr:hypothetical protein [Polyangiaceae bacterium]